MVGTASPTSLEGLILGEHFYQRADGMDRPVSLRNLTLEDGFKVQGAGSHGVTWPGLLRTFAFGNTK